MFSFCIMWWTALGDWHDGNEQKNLKTTTDGLVDDGPPKVTRYHMRIPQNFSNLCNFKFFLFIFFGIFFKNSHDCSFLLKILQIVVFFTKLRFAFTAFLFVQFLNIIFYIFFGQSVSCLTICFLHQATKSARTSPFNSLKNCISTIIIVKNQGFSKYFTQTFTQKIDLPTSSYSKKNWTIKQKKMIITLKI